MNNSYFWNNLELSTPVILSSPLNCSNAYSAVSKLRSVVVCIQNTMKDFKQLNLEAAALSRLIYRTKYKLRQEKSFKTLQMINRCLTNYLSIHLPFTINSIQDSLIDDRGPSRQMLEWALVRLLSVAHLFHRVYSLCTLAAGHLFVRMKLRQMYELTFFAVAVVSRIWTYSQFIVRKSCEWYSSLYQFLDKLQPSPHPWLPEGGVLPTDLPATLGYPEYLKLKSVCKPDELTSQLETSVSETDKAQMNSNMPPTIYLDDIGETVSRESADESFTLGHAIGKQHVQNINKVINGKYEKQQNVNPHVVSKEETVENREPSSSVQKKHKATKVKDNNCRITLKTNSPLYRHSIKSIKSSNDLSQFLEVEAALRKRSSNAEVAHQPIIKTCDKLQWSIIERFMKKQIKLLSKSEVCGNLKLQEKLLRRVRTNIKDWMSY